MNYNVPDSCPANDLSRMPFPDYLLISYYLSVVGYLIKAQKIIIKNNIVMPGIFSHEKIVGKRSSS